jgi:hypothetical protein
MPRLLVGLVLLTLGGLAGCPTPKSPKGPPPEYEEPPAPSWLAEAGAPPADAAAGAPDGGAAPP